MLRDGTARERVTYHDRVYKGSPITPFLKQRKNEGYGCGAKQDDDELVFELFQDKLPQWCRGILWQGWKDKLAGYA
jgi:hypothetical protein